MKRGVYVAVALVTCVRMYIAARYPLTEDEAYYWVWSRHLAYGYLDHPPAVAWLIAAGSWLGHSPLAIRLPFILCEAFAAIFVGQAAIALSGSQTAGSVAAIALTLTPQLRWIIGEALPDGPYVLCWSAALLCAARTRAAWLGVAFGGALLSRFFGWALVGGTIAYALMPRTQALRRTLWIALLIALAMYAPFLLWNAKHGWANFSFTLHGRHPIGALSMSSLSDVSTLRFLLFAALFCVVAYFVTVRIRLPLLAWTALPFPIALAALSFFQPIGSYWLLGPFVSLCAGIGIVFERLPLPVRAIAGLAWAGGFAATASIALIGGLAPSAKFGGESAVYALLSRDLASLARTRQAAVVSDSYEIASELVYNGTPATVVGNSPQARQWSFWATSGSARPELFVTSDSQQRPIQFCAQASPGPVLRYVTADSGKAYDTFWCR